MEPLTLFDQPPALPEGFQYYPEFINDEQEHQLITAIMKIDLHPMVFQGYLAKRKVASFGFDFNFATRKLTKGQAIPETFYWLTNKIATHLAISPTDIAELLITEYSRGSVINWHRDAPPFDQIAGVSLRSDCVFKLRPYKKEDRSRKSIISLPVKNRSLYTMRGSARTDWEHSTAPVMDTRYSITVRTLKNG